MKLIIFEDHTFENFYPLSLIRPLFELRCGATSLVEKIRRQFSGLGTGYVVRDYLADTFRQKVAGASVNEANEVGDDVLIVNGRWLCLGTDVSAEGPDEVGTCGDTIVFIRAGKEALENARGEDFCQTMGNLRGALPNREIKAELISYCWDLVHHNPDAVIADFEALGQTGVHSEMHPLSCVYGEESQIYVAPNVEIHPQVVLDTTGGPIIIEEGVIIYPHSRIEGPNFIGRNSRIVGGKIREGCSIGPVCRVGGEVEESIIHGYSNKYHDGFLGHAYVGEWVNLGALTTNSDLKNDYSNVEVKLNGKTIDTGDTKAGAFIGDHTKTSIGTLFNTGTIVGMMTNILGGSEILPKSIPSFCLFANGKAFKGFGLKKLLQTAETAMGRRDIPLTEEDRAVLAHAYELTKEERTEAVKKARREIYRK